MDQGDFVDSNRPLNDASKLVVQCLVNKATANAPSWQPSCNDKIATIYNIDVNWDAGIPDVQLIFLEVPCPCTLLGDRVWHDLNGNGLQEAGEPGVDGVTVQLFRSIDGALMGTTTTSNGGLYSFSPIPGDYYVKFSNLPAGFTFSPSSPSGVSDPDDSDVNPATGMADTTSLLSSETDLTWDAGIYQMASIGNLVFSDINTNGIQDGGGEVGVDGVTVELFTCAGNVLKATTTTSNGGLYNFTVAPGSYYVKFSGLPAGFVLSPSTAGSASDPTDSDPDPATGKTDCTLLSSGENDPTWDAGIYQPTSIGDFVWNDVNANGQQDAGEAGVAGSTVTLWRCGVDGLSGTADDVNTGLSQVTPASGAYLFSNLAPGCYFVKFTTPAGYTPTVANSGADGTDSDSVAGVTGPYTLAAGVPNLTVDAGFYQPSTTCVADTVTFSGSTATSGSHGNIRTFTTATGVSVKVSGFSRVKSTGAWNAAYVGVYPGGLGVTDGEEGDGSGDAHTVDNIGRQNYLLFEFSQPVIVDRAFMGFVIDDSDLTAWVGTFTDPFNNHLTLNDSLLNSFGFTEENTTTDTVSRWADLNGGQVVGNAFVVAAMVSDTTPEDRFKLEKIDFCKPTAPSLPSPWLTKDIGDVGAAGSASYSGTTFTVKGSGDNIDGNDDEFRYVYQTATGDSSVVAKVLTVQNTNSKATAGILIRETLNKDSMYAGVFVTPTSGIQLKTRSSTGGSNVTKTVSGLAAPYWLKVVRQGNTFTAYRSTNGSTWTQVDAPVTITMGASVYIGLGVNSYIDGTLCTGTFDNVTATP